MRVKVPMFAGLKELVGAAGSARAPDEAPASTTCSASWAASTLDDSPCSHPRVRRRRGVQDAGLRAAGGR